ncbi:MAG: aminotransferase class V-fold PLP-dependent enzyme, partial [Candidatus Sulfotelmatobacter sp.]
EESLSLEMLRVLSDCGAVVYGVTEKEHMNQRVPTLCFNLPNVPPARVSEELAKENIGARDGHMYTPRLMKRLGLPIETGAVRASLVHYNTVEEVRRFGRVLSEITKSC